METIYLCPACEFPIVEGKPHTVTMVHPAFLSREIAVFAMMRGLGRCDYGDPERDSLRSIAWVQISSAARAVGYAKRDFDLTDPLSEVGLPSRLIALRMESVDD